MAIFSSVISVSGNRPGDAQAAWLTSVTFRGGTWSFTYASGPDAGQPARVPIRYSALGVPHLDTAALPYAVNVMDAPACGIYTSAGVDYEVNGVMLDPVFPDLKQGWSALVGAVPVGDNETFFIPYDAAKNIAPSKAGNPAFVINPGDHGCLVKALNRAVSATTQTRISGYSWLTFADARFLADFGPMPMTRGGPRAPMWTMADIDAVESKFGTYTVSGAITAENMLARSPLHHVNFGSPRGEPVRTICSFALDPALNSNYTGDYAPLIYQALLGCHLNYSWSVKREVLARACARGEQAYRAYQRGWVTFDGAGQGNWGIADIFTLALVTGNSGVIAALRTMRENAATQYEFVTADMVGRPVEWVENFKRKPDDPSFDGLDTERRYTPCDPDYDIGTVRWNPPTNFDGKITRYNSVSDPSIFVQNLFMLLTDTELLTGGVTVATNRHVLNCWAMDTCYANWPEKRGGAALLGWTRALWEAARSTIPIPIYPGRPSQIDLGDVLSDNRLTQGTGAQINYTFSDVLYTARPRTQFDIRHSQDQVMWVESLNVATAGSISVGGLGKYYVSVRHWNNPTDLPEEWADVGPWTRPTGPQASKWSYNHAYTGLLARSERNTITLTGTLTPAAPAFPHGAKLYRRRFGFSPVMHFDEMTGALPADTFEVWAGTYVTGYPTPPLTVEWRVDGAVVSGEVARNFFLRPDDLGGKNLQCFFSATNSEGTASVATNIVTTPAVIVDPDGVLIDTEFGGDFKLQYPAHWASCIVNAGVLTHAPFLPFPGYTTEDEEYTGPETSPGGIFCNKDGQRPRIGINIAAGRPLVAGKTYSIEAHIPTGYFERNEWTLGNLQWVLQKGTSWPLTGFTQVWVEPTPQITHVNTTYTVPGGETDLTNLWFFVRNGAATGLQAGGDPGISYLRVVEVP